MIRYILLLACLGLLSACTHFETRDAVRIVAVEPVYPEHARVRGIEGRVIIEYVIDENGVPTDLQVVDADPPGLFERAALRAVSAWRYQPALRYGKPVKSPEAEAVLLFELNKP